MTDLRLKLTSGPAENTRIVVRSDSKNSTILFSGALNFLNGLLMGTA